jgi:ribosomal protein S19
LNNKKILNKFENTLPLIIISNQLQMKKTLAFIVLFLCLISSCTRHPKLTASFQPTPVKNYTTSTPKQIEPKIQTSTTTPVLDTLIQRETNQKSNVEVHTQAKKGIVNKLLIKKINTLSKKGQKRHLKNYDENSRMNAPALIGFIISILGMFFIPIEVASLILGIIGLSQINNEPDRYKGKGFAIASIVISAVTLLLGILVLLILLLFLASI